jgi:hypothetical protein
MHIMGGYRIDMMHHSVRYTLQNFPESRAALSLLGYCHYYVGQFDLAAQM